MSVSVVLDNAKVAEGHVLDILDIDIDLDGWQIEDEPPVKSDT